MQKKLCAGWGGGESTNVIYGINNNYLLVIALITSVILDAIIKKDKTGTFYKQNDYLSQHKSKLWPRVETLDICFWVFYSRPSLGKKSKMANLRVKKPKLSNRTVLNTSKVLYDLVSILN